MTTLDEFTMEQLRHYPQATGNCAGIVSGKNEDIVVFDDDKNNPSKYMVLFLMRQTVAQKAV